MLPLLVTSCQQLLVVVLASMLQRLSSHLRTHLAFYRGDCALTVPLMALPSSD